MKRTLSLLLVILVAASAVGCGSSNRTEYETVDCYDIAGNLLQGCEQEISVHRWDTSIKIRFKGETVAGALIDAPYDEWVADGKPSSDVRYVYYFSYNSTGDRHALLYEGNDSECWDVPLYNKNGDYIGSAYVGSDGAFLTRNVVTGDSNRDRDQESIEADQAYYYDQAVDLLKSLDPNYLPKLDPESSVLKQDLQASSESREESKTSDDNKLPEGAISWKDAAKHIGETVTVYGPVVGIEYAKSSEGQPTFLDIGAEYPSSNRLTITIWGEDRNNFKKAPEKAYKGKTICVTGEIYLYEDTCYIKVTSPKQISVV